VHLYGLCVSEDESAFRDTFENGSTDHWEIRNGSQTNKWMVGNATASSGTRSIYISNNNGSNSYTTTSTSIVHFDDVILFESEGRYTLTYDYKGVGENNYDLPRIYLCDTDIVPDPGSFPSSFITYLNGPMNSIWSSSSFTLPSQPVNSTRRVIFTWRNDNSGGVQPPAAFDNITLLSPYPQIAITPPHLVFEDTTVGTTSAIQTISIRNTGTAYYQSLSFQLIGANADQFSYNWSGDLNPGPGDPADSLAVFFTPTSSGRKSARIGINYSDGYYEVSVEGNATPLSENDDVIIPAMTALAGNYPNPFNPETTIRFSVASTGEVSININSIKGQLVRTLVHGTYGVGVHSAVWNGRDEIGRPVSSGIYFYRMVSGDFVSVKKMIWIDRLNYLTIITRVTILLVTFFHAIIEFCIHHTIISFDCKVKRYFSNVVVLLFLKISLRPVG